MNRGTSGSEASDTELSDATAAVMTKADAAGERLKPRTGEWFAKYYKGGSPVIRSLSHRTDRIGMTLPVIGTIHAEQFISKDIINGESTATSAAGAPPLAAGAPPLAAGQYRGEGGTVKEAPAGFRKVVRIGGVLDDCALCHMDHHGTPHQAGAPTASNPRLARTADRRMIFTGEGGSSDAALRPHGKGIMTTGTHWRAAHGVATQSPQPALHIGGQGITVPTQIIAPVAPAPVAPAVPAPAEEYADPLPSGKRKRR